MKKLVVTIANKDFLNQAKQLFSSVYWNSNWNGDYMLISQGIPEEDLRWFREKDILVREIDIYKDVVMGSNYNPIILCKIEIFKEYFKKWEKIIYLDCDIIVTSSLNNLLKINTFGAVKDLISIEENIDKDIIPNEEYKQLQKKYKLNKRCFNSGVFVFDTKIIKNNTFKELYSYIEKKINYIKFEDQFILNIFFYNKWNHLPDKYNVYVSKIKKLKKLPSDTILHFVTNRPNEPRIWQNNNQFFNIWNDSFKKADLIKSVRDIKKIDKKERRKIKLISENQKIYIKDIIDKEIGKIGILLNKKNPRFYLIVKKFLSFCKNTILIFH